MKRWIVLGMALLVACTGGAGFSFLGTTEAPTPLMEKAEPLLHEFCPDLAGRHDQFQLLPAEQRRANLADGREMDWAQVVDFKLIVNTNVGVTPREMGQHCSYTIGLEPQAGLIVSKRGCISLCDARSSAESFLTKRR